MKFVCIVLLHCVLFAEAEYLSLSLSNERSSTMMLSSFGFLKGATFSMNMSLTFPGTSTASAAQVGLRFDKTNNGGRKDYKVTGGCSLDIVTLDMSALSEEKDVARAVLRFFNQSIHVYHYRFSELKFFENKDMIEPETPRSRDVIEPGTTPNPTESDENEFILFSVLPLSLSKTTSNWTISMSLYFEIATEDQAGLYELYLHNCDESLVIQSGEINILQRNVGSFLSAGDISLPTMYAVMAGITLLTSLLWAQLLCRKRSMVFKIHYLMSLFLFIKALSITFHAIDYYFIGKGVKQEAWAVIFYIVHLLKGTLLFICLLLIGTGWAFIKYVLSDREKKLFMVVIPIQVVANIAYMINEESGFTEYSTITWTELMFLFDVLCFGIILISVSWSIRHLHSASETDGKAAISVVKLKLFQHFYVMVILYLYFRRVLVYLLQISLPFQYTWFSQLFYEIVSLLFFIITGYKFRPGCDNPYLSVPSEDLMEIESEALTGNGVTETLMKVNQSRVDSDDDDETVVLLQRNKTSFV